jgi:ketosteroid isomerase-like protein
MKTICFALAALAAHLPTYAAAADEPRAVVEAAYEAFAQGDMDRFAGLMDPDIVWNEAEGNPYADLNPYEGPEAVMTGLFSRLAAEWESVKVTPNEYVVDGGRVVVFGRYNEGYKATGEHLNIPFVHSWTVADSKLAEFQQYTDTAALVAAMSRSSGAGSVSSEVASTGQLNYATGDPATWPAQLDAVIAAPDNHKVLLENDHVRVLEVTLGPGEVEPLHSHRWPSVLHIQQAGHFLDRDADGNVIFDSREAPPLELPLTLWKGPEAPHSPVNLSEDTEIRLIRVELKQAPTP